MTALVSKLSFQTSRVPLLHIKDLQLLGCTIEFQGKEQHRSQWWQRSLKTHQSLCLVATKSALSDIETILRRKSWQAAKNTEAAQPFHQTVKQKICPTSSHAKLSIKSQPINLIRKERPSGVINCVSGLIERSLNLRAGSRASAMTY